MEGKEMSSSHRSEESSILDLPSACDLAERFLPPHNSENTEELFYSVDTFPSPPTDSVHLTRVVGELHGAATTLCSTALCYTEDSEVYLPSGMTKPSSPLYLSDPGESNPPSAVPASFSAGGYEKANGRCYAKAGLCEPTEPNNAAVSWVYERDGAEDTSVRKSLDGFYEMYCKKRPDRMDPTYKAASLCLSQKISELANWDGTKYASRCLQMAQVVLNRDGCNIFPNHATTACFAKPAEGEVVLEDRKRTPGLSDEVLQFLLKQTRADHSPDVPCEK